MRDTIVDSSSSISDTIVKGRPVEGYYCRQYFSILDTIVKDWYFEGYYSRQYFSISDYFFRIDHRNRGVVWIEKFQTNVKILGEKETAVKNK